MKIDLVFSSEYKNTNLDEAFFIKIMELSLKEAAIKFNNIGVSVNIVGIDKIVMLNKEYRHKNMPTDVLSFPVHEKIDGDSTNYDIIDLGDIFICLPVAEKEARGEKVSLKKKIAQLAVHGFLHLAGYDHEKSDRDQRTMFELEGKILNKLSSLPVS